MKKKTFIVQILDSKKPSRTSFTQVEDALFYSNDTDAYLVFLPHEQEGFEFNEATVALYNTNDESLVERPAVIGTFEGRKSVVLKMTEDILAHWGRWQAQVVFKQGDKINTSVVVRFDTLRYMLDQRPPTLRDVIKLDELYSQLVTVMDEIAGKDVISAPEIIMARGGEDTLGERLDKEHTEVTAQLAQTHHEATRKRQLEDLDEKVISAIEGGEGTSFNLLSVPQDDSVTMDKISFKKKSTNLFNVDTKLRGYYVGSASGRLVENASFQASDFISVEPETDYFIKRVRHYVFYDENKEHITGVAVQIDGNDLVITSPANARYLRFSWENETSIRNQQVNRGTEELPFEPFYELIKSENVEKWPITSLDVAEGSLGPDKTTFAKRTKNLFNKETITRGYFVNQSTGNLAVNAGHYTSDFIEVKPGEFYTFSRSGGATRYAFYTRDKEFIEGGINPDLPIQAPQNASYIRFSQETVNSPDTMQFEQNTTPTSYEPFGFTMPHFLMEKENQTETSHSKSDFYGKFNLKNFQSQASKYINDNFSERLEIAILGDSWVRSGHRIALPLRRKLNDIYGNAGIGFVGLSEIRLGNGETITSITGSWEEINREKGLDMRQYQSSEVGATLKLVTHEPSDYLEIHHIQQEGSYRYRVNEGEWSTVDTSQGTFVTDTFDSNNITLELEVLSGTVTLLNFYLFNGNRGSVVHKLGYGGARAGQFASIDREHFISEFKKTNIHSVGILLGTNDMAQNIAIPDFKADILEIVDRIKTAKPLADVFLISPSGNNLSRAHTMGDYDKVLEEVAHQEELGYVSLYKNMGTFEEQNARGLFEDDVHPNQYGGYQITNVVYDRLLRVD